MQRLRARHHVGRSAYLSVAFLLAVGLLSLVPIDEEPARAAEPDEKECEAGSLGDSWTAPEDGSFGPWMDGPTVVVPAGAQLWVYASGTESGAGIQVNFNVGTGWGGDNFSPSGGTFETEAKHLKTNNNNYAVSVQTRARGAGNEGDGITYVAHFIVGYPSGTAFPCARDIYNIPDDGVIGPDNPSCPHCRCAQEEAADPVNTLTGNYYDTWIDLAVPGRGFGLGWGRSYNSVRSNQNGPLGLGWTHRFNLWLEWVDEGVIVHQESGSEVFFMNTATGYEAGPWIDATFASNSGGYRFTRNGGRDIFQFNSTPRLEWHEDLDGTRTELDYDTAGRLETVTDEAGRELAVDYGTDDLIDEVTDPEGRVATYGYTSGRLSSVVVSQPGDSMDVTWVYTYEDGPLTTVRAPRFQDAGSPPLLVNNYVDGKVQSQTDAEGRQTSFDYEQTFGPDQTGTLVTFNDGDQRADEYVDNLCSAVTHGYGTSYAARTSYTRHPDTFGITSATDALNHTTSFEYDTRGNLTKVTDPLGRQTQAGYNDQNMPLYVFNADAATGFSYDATGTHVESIITRANLFAPALRTITLDYDTNNPGDITKLTDERGKEWLFDYDDHGNVIAVTDPEGGTTTAEYDDVGRLERIVEPEGNKSGGVPGDWDTLFGGHAVFGAPRTVTNPEGEATQYAYDEHGNVTSVTDAEARTTTYGYNNVDQLTVIDRPGTADLANTYHPDGTLASQVDGASQPTTYGYDDLNRLTSTTDPLGRTTGYKYDVASRLIGEWTYGPSYCAPGTGCTSYGYNDANELTSVDYNDPPGHPTAPTPDITAMTYDATGRPLSQQTSTGGQTTWDWDPLGRLESRSHTVEGTVAYTYEGASPLVDTITYPGSKVVSRDYDDAGRLTSMTDWASQTTTFAFDANSRLTETLFPTATGNKDVYGYDRAGRMSSVEFKKGANVLASIGYGRDDTGMVDATTPAGIAGDTATTYGYTGLKQLENVSGATVSFAFDAADNLTRLLDGTTQQFDVANQLCWTSPSGATGACDAPPSDATVYTYDGKGNRASAVTPDGETFGYGYDAANRMVSSTKPTPVEEPQVQYTPLTQSRILDTRVNQGTCDAAPCNRMTVNETMRFDVLGHGGIPATGVEAVVVNVTLINPGGAGFVKINQVDGSNAAAALMHFPSGENVNSMVIAVPDADGYLKIWTNQAVDPVVDVVGYYAAPDGNDGTVFEAITPTRLVDTRVNQGICPTNPCTKPAANQSRQVKVAGQAGVPASGVQAVTINLSALSPAATGHFKVNASSVTGTGTATLNYQSGESANMTTVAKLSATGTITIHTSVSADILIDVVGYHVAGTGPDDHVFNPVAPIRVAKSSELEGDCETTVCQRLTANQTVDIAVAGQHNIPTEGIVAVAASVTIDNPGATGFAKVAPVTTTGAAAATMHYQSGQSVNDLVIAQLDGDGRLPLYSQQAADFIIEITGWYIPGDQSTNTWTYTYTGDGLRTSKTSPTGEVTTYTWDHNNPWPLLIAETTNGDTTRWTYGPDLRPIAQHNPDGTITYLHHDQLGSTRLLTDQSGDTAGSYTYSPYGQITDHTGNATTPLGFASEYHDAETGFQYLRARYYDPSTGQFTTRDPLTTLTRSPHKYAENSPHNLVDPTGALGVPASWSSVVTPGTAATAASVVLCIVGSFAVCAAASFGAWAVRSGYKIGEEGWDGAKGDILADFFITWLTIGVAGIADEGLAVAGQLKVGDKVVAAASKSIEWLGRGLLGAWDVAILAVELIIAGQSRSPIVSKACMQW